MDTNKYNNLPETIDTNLCESLIVELLNDFTESNRKKKIDYFLVLSELANKQWHNYEYLNESVIIKLEEWILKNWNRNSLDETYYVLFMTTTLGLKDVFQVLITLLNKTDNSKTKKLINEFLKEGLKDRVDDPWISMR